MHLDVRASSTALSPTASTTYTQLDQVDTRELFSFALSEKLTLEPPKFARPLGTRPLFARSSLPARLLLEAASPPKPRSLPSIPKNTAKMVSTPVAAGRPFPIAPQKSHPRINLRRASSPN
jgi:hypothetical protein